MPRVALAVFAAAAMTCGACGGDENGSPPEIQPDGPGDPSAPNFVVVQTDDQSVSTFTRRVMPRTFRLLVDRGTRFRNSFASPPRCCPSRAGLLTGQYPHNHGILWNNPDGLTQPQSTLPGWLREQGYETALVGKFLNGYVSEENAEPAPGFSHWFALSAEGEPSYTDPEVSDGEELRTFQDTYLTSLLNRRAVSFVREAGKGPFFLWQAHYAPHARSPESGPCEGFAPEPLPRDYLPFADDQAPQGPAYNERDVSDKPRIVRELPRMDARSREQAARNFRCSEAALREVDRGVAQLVRELRVSGELRDTVFVFTSDNGMLFGEHRFPHGKVEPYEESIAVPLVIRAEPELLGGDPPRNVDEVVANIDLAPTFAGIADVDTCVDDECREVDGRSLAALLRGHGVGFPADRAILMELEPPGECGYQALRAPEVLYVERRDDRGSGCEPWERELYDLETDPFQLSSQARSEPQRVAKLGVRLAGLAQCAGPSCE